jgi:hypothetical protein
MKLLDWLRFTGSIGYLKEYILYDITKRIMTDLVFPMQRPPKIRGTSDVIVATQRLLHSS